MGTEANDSFWGLIQFDPEKVEKEIATGTIKALKQSPSKYREEAINVAHEKFNNSFTEKKESRKQARKQRSPREEKVSSRPNSGRKEKTEKQREKSDRDNGGSRRGKRQGEGQEGRDAEGERGDKRGGNGKSDRRVKWKKPEEEKNDERESSNKDKRGRRNDTGNQKAKARDQNVSKSKGEMSSTETESPKSVEGDTENTEDNPDVADVVADVTQDGTQRPEESAEDNATNKKDTKLRFRWFKSLDLKCDTVSLTGSFSQAAVVLKWCEERQSFESEELIVPCGAYTCKLQAEGGTYSLEQVDVKFYTFEVDLYIEEEDEPLPPPQPEQKAQPPAASVASSAGSSRRQTPSQSPTPRARPPDGGPSPRTRPPDRAPDKPPTPDFVDARPPSVPLVTDRQEKMDEDFDGESSVRSEGGSSIRRLENLVRQQMVSANGYPAGDPDFRPIPPGGGGGAGANGQERVGEWVAQSGGMNGGRQSASSEQELAGYFTSDQAGSSRRRDHAHRSSDRLSDSGRYGDELRHDPAHRSSDRLSDSGRYGDELRQSDLSGRRSADYHGRRDPDPVRRSASQEFDTTPRGSEPRFSSPRTSPGPGSSRRSPYPAGEQEHHSSYSSLPPMSPISQRSESRGESARGDTARGERREEGEGYRGSQPALRSPLVTSRTTPISSRSHGNQRAPLAPLSVNQKEDSSSINEKHKDSTDTEKEKEKDPATRMHDLEDTVLSLRRTLEERDREIERMTSGATVNGDSKEKRSLLNMTEQEKRIDELIREKENMATEIWKLQQSLEEAGKERPVPAPPLQNGHGGGGHGGGGEAEEEAGNLDNYSPNNPRALGRKVEELSAQLQDLQESNESVVANLEKAERKIGELSEENKALRMQRPYDSQDIEDENRRLREELARMREEALQGYGGNKKDDYSSSFFREEIGQLRNDLRVLRDKNHQLVQDNIKLTEHLQDLEVRRDNYRRGDYNPDRPRPSYRAGGKSTAGPRQAPASQPERGRRDLPPVKETQYDVRRDVRNDVRHDVRDVQRDSRLVSSVKSSSSQSSRRPVNNYSGRDAPVDRERDSRRDLYPESRPDPRYKPQAEIPSRAAPVNGYDREPDVVVPQHRDRRHSGHSDTTEILTMAPPGGMERDHYEPDDRSRRYRPVDDLNDTDKTLEFVDPDLTPTSRDTIEDVLDDLPHPRVARYLPSKVVEDVTESVPSLSGKEAASPGGHPPSRIDNFHPNKVPPSQNVRSHALNPTSVNAYSSSYSYSNQITTNTLPKRSSTVSHQVASHSGVSSMTSSRDVTTGGAPRWQGEQGRADVGGGMPQYHKPAGPDTYAVPELSPLEFINDMLIPNQIELSDLSPTDCKTPYKGEYLDDFLGSRGTASNPCQAPKRRDSIDSGSTESILNEADIELQRSFTGSCSKDSWHGRAHSDHLSPSPPGTPPRSKSPHSTGNFRSVNPKPVATQRNKSASDVRQGTFTTSGKRPFAPRCPGDVNIGDIVKFSRQGGKISKGLVKYLGHLPGKNDTYVGVELEQEMGKHDGIYEGQRYFQCKHNRGCFVAFSKVVMAWGD